QPAEIPRQLVVAGAGGRLVGIVEHLHLAISPPRVGVAYDGHASLCAVIGGGGGFEAGGPKMYRFRTIALADAGRAFASMAAIALVAAPAAGAGCGPRPHRGCASAPAVISAVTVTQTTADLRQRLASVSAP